MTEPARGMAAQTIAAFLAVGAVGPLASFTLGSMSPYSPLYQFVDHVVFLLWPTWSLAVMEVSLGRPLAVGIAIGTNLILFGIIGVFVAGVGKWWIPLTVLWSACLVALSAWAWVGSGRAVEYMRWRALLMAGIVLSVPFYVAWRIHRIKHAHS